MPDQPAIPDRPGDWPEDANHENGAYQCTCCHCGGMFIGYKRRVLCRVCATTALPDRLWAVRFISGKLSTWSGHAYPQIITTPCKDIAKLAAEVTDVTGEPILVGVNPARLEAAESRVAELEAEIVRLKAELSQSPRLKIHPLQVRPELAFPPEYTEDP